MQESEEPAWPSTSCERGQSSAGAGNLIQVKSADENGDDCGGNPGNRRREPCIQNHDRWSNYQERSAQVDDGYVRWVESEDTAYVTDIQAGPKTRGMVLLAWLKRTTGKELYAVGVVDDAGPFWDKAEERNMITGQTDQGFMDFFGWR